MSIPEAPAHSPAPFSLVSLPDGGHVILDAFRDSIAGMAPSRGDHTPEELLATARLFVASPALLASARLGRRAIAQDRHFTIEGATVALPGTLEPDMSTLDEDVKEVVAELDAQLRQIDAAIALAETGA